MRIVILLILKCKQMNLKEKTILTLNDLCELLGLSKSKIYKMTSSRTIKHHKIGGTLLFKHDDILEWIDQHRVPTLEEIKSNHNLNITKP